MRKAILGLDLGGTNIKSVIFDPVLNKIITQGQIPTQAGLGISRVVDNIVSSIKNNLAAAERSRRRITALGIGSAGLVENGMVRNSPNLPGWQGAVPLLKLIRNKMSGIDLSILIENDVNCLVAAEYAIGAAKGYSEVIGLAIGTGVGGGIIIGGKLVTGAHGGAGELGHMTVKMDGPRCKCGNHGCLEAMVGTEAIMERYRSLNSKFRIQNSEFTVAEISVRAKRGEVAAVKTFFETGKILGVALASIANIFNPQVIVLGGGVIQAGKFLIDPAKEEMHKRVMPYNAKGLKIKTARLGPVAGAVGAAILVYRYSAK
ncbi:MAG: ROK family protein [Candidatus Edwardsbacteria bacterium]|nr:ROK family protein [Candidatus Edwardsbacteria bacterium]MBU1576859.1 ROK family protein [Candidatus Edwardsbacteria bacterium]MBU2462845.1 ROK family protein [Candidatus Edwardsbacteria bacterium]MBU2593477.1 ROK family protein [Candidatus Edwardsbacteria bacterium]